MLQEERLERILDVLKKKKHMTNAALCQHLFCSISTLRRDLIRLENNGLIKRWHGGATLSTTANSEISYLFRSHDQTNEKNYIANLAKSLISNHQSLFLDSSSTVAKFCEQIMEMPLVVVTNGIQNIITLNQSPTIQLFTLGGEVKPNALSVVGAMAGENLIHYHADIAILSCRGLSLNGIFEADSNQALLKQKMIAQAKTSILLCDHHKFDSEYFIKSINYTDIDFLITDKRPSEDYIKLLAESGCTLIYEG